ncbi:MAG: hypothetical protein V3W32_06835 [Gemmatimonadota bacterium]
MSEKADLEAFEKAQAQARKDIIEQTMKASMGVDVSKPDRISQCPTCDTQLYTMRKQKLVAQRLREINEFLDAKLAQQSAGEPGFTKSKSGLIVPATRK